MPVVTMIGKKNEDEQGPSALLSAEKAERKRDVVPRCCGSARPMALLGVSRSSSQQCAASRQSAAATGENGCVSYTRGNCLTFIMVARGAVIGRLG